MKTPNAFSTRGGKDMGTGGATPLPKQNVSAEAIARATGMKPTPRKNGPGC